MFCFLNVAIKFLHSFQKVLTFFYKVVENGDFANPINFVLFINESDVGISDFVEVTIVMDGYFIMLDCALYSIYILSYACIVGVIIGYGVVVICPDVIIKIVVYRIFTKNNIFYKIFTYKLFYYVILKYSTLLCNMSLKFVSVISLTVSEISSFLVNESLIPFNIVSTDVIIDKNAFNKLVLSEWCFIRIHGFITIINGSIVTYTTFCRYFSEADL